MTLFGGSTTSASQPDRPRGNPDLRQRERAPQLGGYWQQRRRGSRLAGCYWLACSWCLLSYCSRPWAACYIDDCLDRYIMAYAPAPIQRLFQVMSGNGSHAGISRSTAGRTTASYASTDGDRDPAGCNARSNAPRYVQPTPVAVAPAMTPVVGLFGSARRRSAEQADLSTMTYYLRGLREQQGYNNCGSASTACS
jgi:hypothetical protein